MILETWLRPEIVTALQYGGSVILILAVILVPTIIERRMQRKYRGK